MSDKNGVDFVLLIRCSLRRGDSGSGAHLQCARPSVQSVAHQINPFADPNSTPHPHANSRGPLDGLRVLELGQVLAGPLPAASPPGSVPDAIKVAPPDGGDPRADAASDQNGTSPRR